MTEACEVVGKPVEEELRATVSTEESNALLRRIEERYEGIARAKEELATREQEYHARLEERITTANARLTAVIGAYHHQGKKRVFETTIGTNRYEISADEQDIEIRIAYFSDVKKESPDATTILKVIEQDSFPRVAQITHDRTELTTIIDSAMKDTGENDSILALGSICGGAGAAIGVGMIAYNLFGLSGDIIIPLAMTGLIVGGGIGGVITRRGIAFLQERSRQHMTKTQSGPLRAYTPQQLHDATPEYAHLALSAIECVPEAIAQAVEAWCAPEEQLLEEQARQREHGTALITKEERR